MNKNKHIFLKKIANSNKLHIDIMKKLVYFII